jgi:hypothetical protein
MAQSRNLGDGADRVEGAEKSHKSLGASTPAGRRVARLKGGFEKGRKH